MMNTMAGPGERTAHKSLPADVQRLICEELGERQDFGTLFNCAFAGRDSYLARSAIENMYRIHNKSSVVAEDLTDLESRGTSLEARSNEQQKNTSMWALQWRSIILSSLRSTFYPYCLYIRSLDLRNLAELLNDNIFRDTLLHSFFAGDMARFLKSTDTPLKNKLRGSKRMIYQRIDVPSVLDLVGESITSFLSDAAMKSHADVALEDLAGHISTVSLQRWTSQLSRLKRLTLWDGAVLNNEVALALNATCFEFDDLTFFMCDPANRSSADVDHDLAAFFSTLRSNSLRNFSALSSRYIGPETLLALNNHSDTLRILKLEDLESDSVKHLSYLQGCKSIETLDIKDTYGLVNLEATEHDVFLEIVSWLCACTKLRDLRFSNLVSAPAILESVCLNNDIRLRNLEVSNYTLVNNAPFHRSISQQISLESLKLKADPEESFRDDTDTLVSSISSLKNLKCLNLVSTSDYFRVPEITQLASSLTLLEEFWFGGYEVNDHIWPSLSTLSNLKSLNVHALSTFTADGILNYISTLRDGNQGILLSVMNQSLEHNLSDAELALVRQSIKAQADGQFDYVLFRDYESDDESFSD